MDPTATSRGETRAPAGMRDGARAVRQVFRREGEYRTIAYAGTVCRLRDAAGLRHLAFLLGRPGEQVPAIKLVAQHGRSPEGDSTPTSRPRTTTDRERARVSATRAVRAALRRVGEHNAALLEHLNATIRTGANCSHAPDPRRSIAWQL
jgi:hypothetical protein